MIGIVGLVLSIVGLLGGLVGLIWPLSNIITIIALVLAVAGIVLCAIDMKQEEKHGKSIVGMVLAIIAVVIGVLTLVACGGAKQKVNDAVKDLQSNYSAEELAAMSEEEQEQALNEALANVGGIIDVEVPDIDDEALAETPDIIDEAAEMPETVEEIAVDAQEAIEDAAANE